MNEIYCKNLEYKNLKIFKKQINQIVRIHIASFRGFFLSFLGKKFLYKLYLYMAQDKNCLLISAHSSDQIVGFVAGTIDQKNFYKSLIKKHKWKFALAALPACIKKPKIIPRVLRALKKPKEAEEYSSKACLMSIGVDPKYQGMGIGNMLVNEFSRELIRRGCETFCLTTDRDNNEKANMFYQKLGFKLARIFITPEGRHMNEYIKILDRDE